MLLMMSSRSQRSGRSRFTRLIYFSIRFCVVFLVINVGFVSSSNVEVSVVNMFVGLKRASR